MQFDNQKTRNVAEIAARIMAGETVSEELKGNQHKIDKNKNNKIDAQDFKLLRKEEKKETCSECGEESHEGACEMKEEVQQIDELSKGTLGSYVKKASDDAAKSASSATSFAYTSTAAKNPRVKAAAAKYSNEDEAKEKKRLAGIGKAVNRLTKEETDEAAATILEYESKDGKFVHNAKAGRYGGSEKPTDPFAGVRGPGKKDIEKIEKEKKKKKPFSEMVNQYQQTGLKSLSEMFIKEEPTNDEYKKELDDVKAKASGAKTNPDIAKGKVDAVKNEEVEQIDEISKELATSYLNKREAQHKPNMNSPETSNRDAKVAKGIRGAVSRVHGYGPDKAAENKVTGRMAYRKSVGATHTFNKEEVEQIDEREMTDSEMKKREEIVKSMKKGMAGFKERYGDRAKNVMYATATKQAMKD